MKFFTTRSLNETGYQRKRSRRNAPGRFGGNTTRRLQEKDQRNSDAPADYEAPTAGGGDRALSSALQHWFCCRGRRATDLHDSRIRGFFFCRACAISDAWHARNGQAGGGP